MANVFSKNANDMNLKCSPIHGRIYKSEKIQQAFWREIKAQEVSRNIKGCILEASLEGQGW